VFGHCRIPLSLSSPRRAAGRVEAAEAEADAGLDIRRRAWLLRLERAEIASSEGRDNDT